MSKCPNCGYTINDFAEFDAGMGTSVCRGCNAILRKNTKLEAAMRMGFRLFVLLMFTMMPAIWQMRLPEEVYDVWLILFLAVGLLMVLVRAKWSVDSDPKIAALAPPDQASKPRCCPACGNRVGYFAYYALKRNARKSALCSSCLSRIKANPRAAIFHRLSYWLGMVLVFASIVPVCYWIFLLTITPFGFFLLMAGSMAMIGALSHAPVYLSYCLDPLIRADQEGLANPATGDGVGGPGQETRPKFAESLGRYVA